MKSFRPILLLLLLSPSCQPPKSPDPIPAWTTEERTFLIEGLTRTRDALLKETEGLSDEQWNFKESPERWSIAQIVEHLEVQDEAYSVELRVIPNQPEMSQYFHLSNPDNDKMLLAYATDTAKADAGSLAPIGRFCSQEAATAGFTRIRNMMIERLSTTDKDFRKYFTFRNFQRDGKLSNVQVYDVRDLHQLMLTCIAHTERHTAQLRKVKQHLGYPGREVRGK